MKAFEVTGPLLQLLLHHRQAEHLLHARALEVRGQDPGGIELGLRLLISDICMGSMQICLLGFIKI